MDDFRTGKSRGERARELQRVERGDSGWNKWVEIRASGLGFGAKGIGARASVVFLSKGCWNLP
jgi:hypothetical protein